MSLNFKKVLTKPFTNFPGFTMHFVPGVSIVTRRSLEYFDKLTAELLTERELLQGVPKVAIG